MGRRIGRRAFLGAAAMVLTNVRTTAGQGRRRRIGFVSPIQPGRRDAAFVAGLRKLGYVPGENLEVELRFANAQRERFREHCEELVRLGVDVLVAGSTIGGLAAKTATSTIPVVFAGSSDPVAAGLVDSLARPGGNATGVSLAYDGGVAGKWPELLKELAPRIAHVAVLWSASNPASVKFVDEAERVARKLKLGVQRHMASKPPELDAALAAIAGGRADALIVMPSPFASGSQSVLVRFGAERKLPAIYFVEDFVEAGGLMSYGPSIAEAYGRAATYVDRILKGAKPAGMPVEQPDARELFVNRATAQSLGLAIPPSILVRAQVVG